MIQVSKQAEIFRDYDESALKKSLFPCFQSKRLFAIKETKLLTSSLNQIVISMARAKTGVFARLDQVALSKVGLFKMCYLGAVFSHI